MPSETIKMKKKDLYLYCQLLPFEDNPFSHMANPEKDFNSE